MSYSAFPVCPPNHFQSPEFKIRSNVLATKSKTFPVCPDVGVKPKQDFSKYGRIQLITGPMFSGKSTELLRKMRVFEVAKHCSLIIKYSKDKRYDNTKISTHDKQMRQAINTSKLSTIDKSIIDSCTIIGIDEGQFFEDVEQFCVKYANLGKIVIVAALDGTFEQKPFQNILNLIPHSESVVKLSAVCMACFREAAFTRRLDPSDKRVEVIGSEDIYAAVCRRCLGLNVVDFKNRLTNLRRRTSSGKFIENDSETPIKKKKVDNVVMENDSDSSPSSTSVNSDKENEEKCLDAKRKIKF